MLVTNAMQLDQAPTSQSLLAETEAAAAGGPKACNWNQGCYGGAGYASSPWGQGGYCGSSGYGGGYSSGGSYCGVPKPTPPPTYYYPAPAPTPAPACYYPAQANTAAVSGGFRGGYGGGANAPYLGYAGACAPANVGCGPSCCAVMDQRTECLREKIKDILDNLDEHWDRIEALEDFVYV